MPHVRFERHVVVSGERSEGRICAGALGDKFLGAGFGCGWVLGNRRLDAFDGEPVRW